MLRLGALAATKQAPAAAAVVTVVVTLVGLRLLGRRRGALIEIALRRDAPQVRVALGLALAQHWGAQVVPKAVPIDVEVVDQKNAEGFSW